MRQARSVLWGLGLRREIGEVDVPQRVAGHGDDRNPAIAALAGLVPWAETGIRQTVRFSPFAAK